MAGHDKDHDDDHHDDHEEHDEHGGGHGGGGHGGGGHGGGGGGHEEGGGGHGAPLWVVSFCDMTILEMSFFVILLAGASQKSATDDDILKMLATIKAGFGYVPKADSTTELDLAVLQILAHKRSKISSRNQIRPSNPAVTGEQLRDRDLWVQVKGTLGKPIIFEENSTEIPLSQDAHVEAIATIVRAHYKVCVVQGHCTPQESERDPKGGYEIAFRRAWALKTALEQRGVPSARMRLVICSSYDQFRETKSGIQRRAVVTMGNYYLPGGDQSLDIGAPAEEPVPEKKAKSGH